MEVFSSVLRKSIAGKSAVCLPILLRRCVLGQMFFTHLAGTGRCFSACGISAPCSLVTMHFKVAFRTTHTHTPILS